MCVATSASTSRHLRPPVDTFNNAPTAPAPAPAPPPAPAPAPPPPPSPPTRSPIGAVVHRAAPWPLPSANRRRGNALSQWHALVNDADDAAWFPWNPAAIPCFLCFAQPACTEEQRHLQVRYQVAHDAGGKRRGANGTGDQGRGEHGYLSPTVFGIYHPIVFFRRPVTQLKDRRLTSAAHKAAA